MKTWKDTEIERLRGELATLRREMEQLALLENYMAAIRTLDPHAPNPAGFELEAVRALAPRGTETEMRALALAQNDGMLLERLQDAEAAAAEYLEFYEALEEAHAAHYTWEQATLIKRPLLEDILAGLALIELMMRLRSRGLLAHVEKAMGRTLEIRAEIDHTVIRRYGDLIEQARMDRRDERRAACYTALHELRRLRPELVGTRVEWDTLVLEVDRGAGRGTFDSAPSELGPFLSWAAHEAEGHDALSAAIVRQCAITEAVICALLPPDTYRQILSLAMNWDIRSPE